MWKVIPYEAKYKMRWFLTIVFYCRRFTQVIHVVFLAPLWDVVNGTVKTEWHHCRMNSCVFHAACQITNACVCVCVPQVWAAANSGSGGVNEGGPVGERGSQDRDEQSTVQREASIMPGEGKDQTTSKSLSLHLLLFLALVLSLCLSFSVSLPLFYLVFPSVTSLSHLGEPRCVQAFWSNV